MKKKEIFKIELKLIILFTFLLGNVTFGLAQTKIGGLQVEYQKEPLGIDIEKPQFSWQMIASDDERGLHQTAYKIVVEDDAGEIVWDTKKVISNVSLAILYDEKKLQPTTQYAWHVTVWDQDDKELLASSWFETGLMDSNPDLTAWDGAKWIGGNSENMVLYSHYLSVFKIQYDLLLDEKSKSTKAAFVFGANDSRLMDKNKNIQEVENKENESYIAFELDITNVNGTKNGLAKFHVYRVGYDIGDSAEKPFRSFDIPLTLINILNKYEKYQFFIESDFGVFEVYLNGKDIENKIARGNNSTSSPFGNNGMNLNPVGKGNDYICFPVVGDIGFSMQKNQKALFSNVQIKNHRAPSNILFSEKLHQTEKYKSIFFNDLNSNLAITKEAYELNGGESGALIIADPSKNSVPMMRTTFKTKNKTIKKVKESGKKNKKSSWGDFYICTERQIGL